MTIRKLLLGGIAALAAASVMTSGRSLRDDLLRRLGRHLLRVPLSGQRHGNGEDRQRRRLVYATGRRDNALRHQHAPGSLRQGSKGAGELL